MSLFPLKRGIPKRFFKGVPYNTISGQTHKFTVPDGKIWWVIEVVMRRVDSSTATVTKYFGEIVGIQLLTAGAGTGIVAGPENVGDRGPQQLHLAWEGDVIHFSFGTAQTTGGDYIVLTVIEFDIEELLEE